MSLSTICIDDKIVIPRKLLLDFAWCRYHPAEHSSPSQNLSPYISLLHQQEHFWPPSLDGLSERKLCVLQDEIELATMLFFLFHYVPQKCLDKKKDKTPCCVYPCTQAVVILKSTTYIAIELNVLHLKSKKTQSSRCAQAILPLIAFLESINS